MILLAALVVHAGAAITARLLAVRLGRRVFLVTLLAPLTTLVLLGPSLRGVLGGDAVTETYSWVPGLGLDIALRLDAFGALMVLLVSGIGVLVMLYAYGYFLEPRDGLDRFAANLVLFAGAMLGLVLADDLLVVYVFWELTSVLSYLLIGTEDHRRSARSAALQALLTTALGGVAMLGGFVILRVEAGTSSISALVADPPRSGLVAFALVLILLGAFTKSAQAPFHYWLPGAMAAPTPVSTYLHSATMVKAGVYLVARLSPAFTDVSPWTTLVVGVGVVTMLIGGWRALRQHDLKLVLAYGTVSQLGFLMVLFGTGTPEGMLAGTAMLLAHGMFKAALFATVGVIDHAARTRDIRRLTGVGRAMPITACVGTLAAASMAGIPPLFGFIGKEAALEALLHGPGGPVGVAAVIGVVLGSVLTAAYSARFVWGAFATKPGRHPDAEGDPVDPALLHEPAPAFGATGIVLAGAGVLLGVLAPIGSALVVPAARAVDPRIEATYLSLWHGFNLPLLISVAILAIGFALWWWRDRVEAAQARLPLVPDAGGAYRAAVNGLLVAADRVTGVVQNGSLPIYLGVILLTVVVLPGSLLIRTTPAWDRVVLADPPRQAFVGALIVVAAVVTTRVRRRFAAVLTLGAVGYGVAVLFVLQGAPDLALTQLLIETLVLVLFVLVLRHLPKDFRPRRWGLGQAPRIAIAAGVGVFFGAFALIATTAQRQPAVSPEYLTRALPEAKGRNVVNTILVDFRAFDTMGEIVVLAVAALGVTALVRAARREFGEPAAEPLIDTVRRSLILDTGVRAVFRTLLLFSLYLLFVGHNAPGGGFIGGLVAGAGLVLVSVSRGSQALERVAPVSSELLLGGGILVALTAGAASWFTEGTFLGHVVVDLTVPVFGDVHLMTTLPFDLGVFFVVVGLVLSLLRSLGRQEMHTA